MYVLGVAYGCIGARACLCRTARYRAPGIRAPCPNNHVDAPTAERHRSVQAAVRKSGRADRPHAGGVRAIRASRSKATDRVRGDPATSRRHDGDERGQRERASRRDRSEEHARLGSRSDRSASDRCNRGSRSVRKYFGGAKGAARARAHSTCPHAHCENADSESAGCDRCVYSDAGAITNAGALTNAFTIRDARCEHRTCASPRMVAGFSRADRCRVRDARHTWIAHRQHRRARDTGSRPAAGDCDSASRPRRDARAAVRRHASTAPWLRESNADAPLKTTNRSVVGAICFLLGTNEGPA